MKENLIIGYNYLHTHKGMEQRLNVPGNHAIVDRDDLEARY